MSDLRLKGGALPLVIGLMGALTLMLFCPKISASSAVSSSLLMATCGVGLLIMWAIRIRVRSARRTSVELGARSEDEDQWGISVRIQRPHLIQTFAQSIVYLGWFASWGVARDQLALLLAQILFAYLVDMALVWRKYRFYRLGFGPIPIVLSTNLFLFFKEDAYYWQWLMIAFAFASREIFRWRRDGRDVHIFNPSAITLTLTTLILITTGQMHLSWGEMIANSHSTGAYSYELIMIAGLIVMSAFTVGLTIVSAVCVTLVVGELYFFQTGVYRYLDTAIPGAVFLGMNLLVTDPASSPKRRDAKVLYGALYGLSVFILYGILRSFESPPTETSPGLSMAFCDKLLAVPLLNLCSRRLDQITARCAQFFPRALKEVSGWRGFSGVSGRALFVLLWIALFSFWVHPQVTDHPGRSTSFWVQACDDTAPKDRGAFACENRNRVYLSTCERGALESCHNMAFAYELGEGTPINLPKAEALYHHACKGGQAMSCNHLGGMLFKRAQETLDPQITQSAFEVLKRACQGRIFEACTRQATLLTSTLYDRSAWGDQEWASLWALYSQACEGGEPFACLEMSQWLLRPPRARFNDCERSRGLGCVAFKRAQDAWSAKKTPVGAHPYADLVQARVALKVSCEAQFPVACANLSWMLWRGDGGEQHKALAIKMMERSCQYGLKEACSRVESMKSQPPPMSQP